MTTVRDLLETLATFPPDLDVLLFDGPRLAAPIAVITGGSDDPYVMLFTPDQVARKPGQPTHIERIALDDPGPIGEIARDVVFGEPDEQ